MPINVVGRSWARSSPTGIFESNPSGTPNALFPALNMDLVPFHVAAGAYGAQLPFQTATPPAAPSNGTASTLSQLSDAMATPGTRVTITGNIIGGNVNIPSCTDVEIIVPFGVTVSGVVLGNGTTGTVFNRLRVRKATGDTIGGVWRNFRILGAQLNDLIIDGLQIAGIDSADPAIYPGLSSGSPNRVAIINNRIRAANAGFGYGGRHYLVAGNSMQHDANNTNNSGDWGWRFGGEALSNGPYIVFRNDIRSNRFAKVRFHPSASGSPYYAYVAQNTTVDRTENRTVDFNDIATTPGFPQIDGGWILDNDFYVNGPVGMGLQRSNSTPTCAFIRVNDNRVYGGTSGLNVGGSPNSELLRNTYDGVVGADPAWGIFGRGAGDPTTIPLS